MLFQPRCSLGRYLEGLGNPAEFCMLWPFDFMECGAWPSAKARRSNQFPTPLSSRKILTCRWEMKRQGLILTSLLRKRQEVGRSCTEVLGIFPNLTRRMAGAQEGLPSCGKAPEADNVQK